MCCPKHILLSWCSCCVLGAPRPAQFAASWQEAWPFLPPQPPKTHHPELEAWKLLSGQPLTIDSY